jgi:hypothetical protein
MRMAAAAQKTKKEAPETLSVDTVYAANIARLQM